MSQATLSNAFLVQVYSNLEGNRSHVVNTGWAMLALIDAGQVHVKSFRSRSTNVNLEMHSSLTLRCLTDFSFASLINLLDLMLSKKMGYKFP